MNPELDVEPDDDDEVETDHDQDRLSELLQQHWDEVMERLPEQAQEDVKGALVEVAGGADDTAELLRLVADAMAAQAEDAESTEMIEGLRDIADTVDFLDGAIDAVLDAAKVDIEEDLSDKLPVKSAGAGGSLPVPFNKKAKDRLKRVPPDAAPWRPSDRGDMAQFSEPPEPHGPAKVPSRPSAEPSGGGEEA